MRGNEGEVWKRLSGATAHALFTDVPREGLSVGTRVHLIYFPDDRSTEPTAIDDLGMSLVQTYPLPGSTPSARAATFDEDCDQLLGTFDAEDGRQKPAIVAEPLELVSTLVGQAVKLSATVVNADGMPKAQWNAGDASLADAPGEPQARIFSAGKPGRYVVVFSAEVGGDTLSQSFAIDVAAPPIVNTPPACRPFASADSGLVGDTVGLKAVVADRETPLEALTVHWGLLNPGADPASAADDVLVDSGLVSGSGESGRLVLGREGKYVVACRAFDGKEWGLPGSVEVAALPVDVNRPPEDAFLSPPVADILLGDSVRLVMRARDPEGKPLTFSFASLPEQDGQGAPLVPDPTSTADRSEIVIKPTEAGLIEVRATASDGEFTTPPEYARIIVRGKGAIAHRYRWRRFLGRHGPGRRLQRRKPRDQP
ncbi:MAG: hypothetical protein KA712_00295 [Myxococcales bacterium]|nr:hypothetical protein [Myxococcales bacterium]